MELLIQSQQGSSTGPRKVISGSCGGTVALKGSGRHWEGVLPVQHPRRPPPGARTGDCYPGGT